MADLSSASIQMAPQNTRTQTVSRFHDGRMDIESLSGHDRRGGGEKGKGWSFWDYVDVINPLQHIPIVNQAYRAITGDTIRKDTQMMGDGLYAAALTGIGGVGLLAVGALAPKAVAMAGSLAAHAFKGRETPIEEEASNLVANVASPAMPHAVGDRATSPATAFMERAQPLQITTEVDRLDARALAAIRGSLPPELAAQIPDAPKEPDVAKQNASDDDSVSPHEATQVPARQPADVVTARYSDAMSMMQANLAKYQAARAAEIGHRQTGIPNDSAEANRRSTGDWTD
ncbi:MAG: hypothetical protein AAGF15_09105 [Pseudomonadota bacterium]